MATLPPRISVDGFLIWLLGSQQGLMDSSSDQLGLPT